MQYRVCLLCMHDCVCITVSAWLCMHYCSVCITVYAWLCMHYRVCITVYALPCMHYCVCITVYALPCMDTCITAWATHMCGRTSHRESSKLPPPQSEQKYLHTCTHKHTHTRTHTHTQTHTHTHAHAHAHTHTTSTVLYAPSSSRHTAFGAAENLALLLWQSWRRRHGQPRSKASCRPVWKCEWVTFCTWCKSKHMKRCMCHTLRLQGTNDRVDHILLG